MSSWDDTTNVSEIPDLALDSEDTRNRAYLIVLAGSNVGEMFKLDGDSVIGRSRDASIRLLDDGISRRHARVLVRDDDIFVEDLRSRNGTYCNGKRIDRRALCDGDKIQVGKTTILKFTYHDELDESFQRQMYTSALRDALTHAYNKRYFQDRIDSEFRFADRHRVPLSLIMIDIDHFKPVNDTHGHLAGDAVLTEISAAIARSIRNEDVFSRYGGEEFAIICRATSERDTAILAERLRRLVAGLQVVHDGTPIAVTISVGVATCPADEIADATDLIAAADRALYRAKQRGRDCVVIYRRD